MTMTVSGKIRVLVVDDSALMRKLIPQTLLHDDSIEVVGTAMDGLIGLRKIQELRPHVVTLEDGSRYKRVDADQLGFKHAVDPMGLLNPGKMRSFVPATE